MRTATLFFTGVALVLAIGCSSSSTEGSCTIVAADGRRACVPATAKASTPLFLRAESVGCLGCGVTAESCSVLVSDKRILLTLQVQQCATSGACPAVCRSPSIDCKIPPLAAGTYSVELAGEAAKPGTRELFVTAGLASTSCSLTPDGPEPISAASYSRTCTADSDCRLVHEGDACTTCGCENAAVSRVSEEAYASDLRARRSQCTADQAQVPCPPCIATTAKCDAGLCVSVTP